MPRPTNYFADRESGQTIRVEKVTEQFASITVVKQLPSTYMMPTNVYDTEFVSRYLPLDIGDIKTPEGFRFPANASEWEAAPAPEPEVAPTDETAEGVRIGADPPMTLEQAYRMVRPATR